MKTPDELRAIVIARKDFASARLSESCRVFAFGSLGLAFSLRNSDHQGTIAFFSANLSVLTLCAIFGVLTLVADYLQYLCSYISVNHTLQRSETSYKYDSSHPAYVFQSVFFTLKNMLAIVCALIVLKIMYNFMFKL